MSIELPELHLRRSFLCNQISKPSWEIEDRTPVLTIFFRLNRLTYRLNHIQESPSSKLSFILIRNRKFIRRHEGYSYSQLPLAFSYNIASHSQPCQELISGWLRSYDLIVKKSRGPSFSCYLRLWLCIYCAWSIVFGTQDFACTLWL